MVSYKTPLHFFHDIHHVVKKTYSIQHTTFRRIHKANRRSKNNYYYQRVPTKSINCSKLLQIMNRLYIILTYPHTVGQIVRRFFTQIQFFSTEQVLSNNHREKEQSPLEIQGVKYFPDVYYYIEI